MERFDRVVEVWIATHRTGALNVIMIWLSTLGRGGLIWIAIALVLTLCRRFTWQGWLRLLGTLVLTSVVSNNIIRPVVDRPRPFRTIGVVKVLGHRPSDASFPSSHSANAFGAASVLTYECPGGTLAYWVLAVAIAYSRLYLGVHYPFDVMSGAVLGALCALLVRALLSPRRLAV